MLAKDILIEIEVARKELNSLKTDLGKIRKVSPDSEKDDPSKDTRTSVRLLWKAVQQAEFRLEDLENTDWERPVKMKK